VLDAVDVERDPPVRCWQLWLHLRLRLCLRLLLRLLLRRWLYLLSRRRRDSDCWSAWLCLDRGRWLRLAARQGNRPTADHANGHGARTRADQEVAARWERLQPFA
jgi:hypothetical protein